MKKLYLCLLIVILISGFSSLFAEDIQPLILGLEFNLKTNEKIKVGFTSVDIGSITVDQELEHLSSLALAFDSQSSTDENKIFTGKFSVYYQIKSLDYVDVYLGYNVFKKDGSPFGRTTISISSSLVSVNDTVDELSEYEHILKFNMGTSGYVTRTDIERIKVSVDVPYQDVLTNGDILETTFKVVAKVV